VDGLWKKRALLLKAISRLLGISSDEPIFVLKQAKKSLNNGFDPERAEVLRMLMKYLRKVRGEIFIQMREKFSKMFVRAEIKFGEEGVSILEENLLSCIDHCKIGMEDSFPAYFMQYAMRAFSEMEDERMAGGFYIPRKDKLLVRSMKREGKENDDPFIPLVRTEVDLADHITAEDIISARESCSATAWQRKAHKKQQHDDFAWWQLPLRKL